MTENVDHLDFSADPAVVIGNYAAVLAAVVEAASLGIIERGTSEVASRAGQVFTLKAPARPSFGRLPPFRPDRDDHAVVVDSDDRPLAMLATTLLVAGVKLDDQE